MSKPQWLDTSTDDIAFPKATPQDAFATLSSRPGKPKIVCKGTLKGPTQAITIRLRPEDYNRLKAASEGAYTAAVAAIVMDRLDELERSQETLTVHING